MRFAVLTASIIMRVCGVENSSRDVRNGCGIQPLFCQGRLQELVRKEMIVFLPMEFRGMFGEIASGGRWRRHNVPECRRDVRRVAVGDLDDMAARARFEAATHERQGEGVEFRRADPRKKSAVPSTLQRCNPVKAEIDERRSTLAQQLACDCIQKDGHVVLGECRSHGLGDAIVHAGEISSKTRGEGGISRLHLE